MALISTTGPICPNVTDTPLDNRSRVSTIAGIGNIPLAWKGMLVYCEENGKTYKITSLKPKTSGPVVIENYYPATWVEFGSGGSTPSPTPSEIDAGDVSYFSSGTFSNNTVGKELQSLASNILGLAEDIHNLSSDIGTLSSLNTENKQDLVAAINEVLASTGSTIAVVDNLVSNSTTDALSAYQGKVLKGLVDSKVAGIKVQGETSVLPKDGNGIVTIPAGGGGTVNATWGSITGTIANQTDLINIASLTNYYTKTQLYTKTEVDALIQGGGSSVTVEDNLNSTSAVNALSANQGRVLKGLINEVNNKILQLGGDPEPIVIPPSAVELPTDEDTPDYFTYDPDTTYVMLISGVQSPTIHYPYRTNNTDYSVFKAIDSDLYYVYSVVGSTYTFVDDYTWSTLPNAAKATFESGIYAVKQVIDVNGTGNPLPDGYWKHGVPSTFVTPDGYPLRYNQIKENNIYYILLKCDELNKIFKYAANANSEWSLVSGGCYTKGDTTTGADYTTYDKYFDTANAVNVEYGGSNVKAALDALYANYTVVTSNLPTMSVSDSIPTPTKNTYYDYGAATLTIVNVSGIPITNTYEVVIRFLTHSSNACTLVLDDTSGYQQRLIGSTSLAKGKVYILSVLRGVVCICEAPAYEAPVVEEPEETT